MPQIRAHKDHQRLHQELDAMHGNVRQQDNEKWVELFCAGVLLNILIEMMIKHPRHTSKVFFTYTYVALRHEQSQA